MKLEREQLIEKVKKYVGDRNDDETIELIEDIYDSVDSENSAKNLKEEIENAVKEIDEKWRKRYIDRFHNGGKEDFIEKKEIDTDYIEKLFN